MRKTGAIAAAVLLTLSIDLPAANLVRMVRYKLSAGDLASGEAAVEEYRRTTGLDAEYLDAVGWLARGAQMLGRRQKAAQYAAEVRKAIPVEDPALLVPLGAAIEVEGRLRLDDGRGAALHYWETELAHAKDPSLRSRIRKNMNLQSLEGERAPEIGGAGPHLASFSGRPVLLFFWAAGCGDCKAESGKLARLYARYAPKGLGVVAPTRLYGAGADDKVAAPEPEPAHIERFWAENYPGLSAVPRPVDTETMVRYGVSATPTYALVDGRGIVRLYAPTRLTEADLSSRIESLLAEADAAKLRDGHGPPIEDRGPSAPCGILAPRVSIPVGASAAPPRG